MVCDVAVRPWLTFWIHRDQRIRRRLSERSWTAGTCRVRSVMPACWVDEGGP
jgi:hypothetical protein